ncbi:MAG: hypothetical protein HRU03_00340 [Nanoarchaeales archaeon]|nr:hypothetical protein [Nanoarchaeales archaeon]
MKKSIFIFITIACLFLAGCSNVKVHKEVCEDKECFLENIKLCIPTEFKTKDNLMVISGDSKKECEIRFGDLDEKKIDFEEDKYLRCKIKLGEEFDIIFKDEISLEKFCEGNEIFMDSIKASIIQSNALRKHAEDVKSSKNLEKDGDVEIEMFQAYINENSDNKLTNEDIFNLGLRLKTGSPALDLNKLRIKIDSEEGSQIVSYNNLESTEESFSIKYVTNNGIANSNNYLHLGEMVIVSFSNKYEIYVNEKITIRLMIEGESITPFDIIVPSLQEEQVYVYP